MRPVANSSAMATRCVDEAPIVSLTSAAGMLEHVSRILVMRPPLPLAR